MSTHHTKKYALLFNEASGSLEGNTHSLGRLRSLLNTMMSGGKTRQGASNAGGEAYQTAKSAIEEGDGRLLGNNCSSCAFLMQGGNNDDELICPRQTLRLQGKTTGAGKRPISADNPVIMGHKKELGHGSGGDVTAKKCDSYKKCSPDRLDLRSEEHNFALATYQKKNFR